jgi:hypothetical protein
MVFCPRAAEWVSRPWLMVRDAHPKIALSLAYAIFFSGLYTVLLFGLFLRPVGLPIMPFISPCHRTKNEVVYLVFAALRCFYFQHI